METYQAGIHNLHGYGIYFGDVASLLIVGINLYGTSIACHISIPSEEADETAGPEEDLWDKLEALIERIAGKFDSLSEKYERSKKKIEYWKKAYNDKRNRKAAEHIKNVVIHVLKKAALWFSANTVITVVGGALFIFWAVTAVLWLFRGGSARQLYKTAERQVGEVRTYRGKLKS